jgi:hypothetical protein
MHVTTLFVITNQPHAYARAHGFSYQDQKPKKLLQMQKRISAVQHKQTKKTYQSICFRLKTIAYQIVALGGFTSAFPPVLIGSSKADNF